MSAPTPELSRPVRIDAIGEVARSERIAADPAERAALAKRFGLLALDRLDAEATLRRDGRAIVAEGRILADAVQACVATGDPVPARIDEPFALRFVPDDAPAGDEVELSEADLDVIPFVGGAIDLGEAVAETLGLALDPFPRSPGADAALREAGVVQEGEEERGPFAAALKGLKNRLV